VTQHPGAFNISASSRRRLPGVTSNHPCGRARRAGRRR
jgi:hypothetical protein